jgi:hypothetical protein
MHRSRLYGFIIDCEGVAPNEAARFWAAALGMAPLDEAEPYVSLDARARDLDVEVQRVDHPSRVHLDIESDDVDAEAARLEALGARRVEKVKTWWVMLAPTGHRFCVVRAERPLEGKPGATLWP